MDSRKIMGIIFVFSAVQAFRSQSDNQSILTLPHQETMQHTTPLGAMVEVNEHWKIQFAMFLLAAAILMLIVSLISCLCTVEELENKHQYQVTYTAPVKNEASVSTFQRISNPNGDVLLSNPLKNVQEHQSEVDYTWDICDDYELFNAEMLPDVKLIKI